MYSHDPHLKILELRAKGWKVIAICRELLISRASFYLWYHQKSKPRTYAFRGWGARLGKLDKPAVMVSLEDLPLHP